MSGAVVSDEERAERAAAESNGDGSGDSESLLEQVRRQLQEDTAAAILDLRLPRKTPQLVARYRVTDPDDFEHLPEDTDRIGRIIALLSKACIGLFAPEPGSAKIQPLLDERGEPVTYANVAQEMGFESESARETILYLFKENVAALLVHGDRVMEWTTDTSQEVEGQVLGESLA